ncbi:hypothetical protein P3W45_000186 [Vairimorpha bombi]|jgi:serine/threonine-protein phosphatase 2A activator
MEFDFLKTPAYKNITDFIDEIVVSIQSEDQTINKKISDKLEDINKLVERIPLSIDKGRFANPNASIVFTNISSDNLYIQNSFGNSKRLDYGTGHELNFLCYCYEEYCKNNLKLNEIFNLLKMYWKVSRKFISKFNLEPAGSKGTWTLDSYQLLPYVFGSAESCLSMKDWYKDLLDDCKSVLALRMFSRHWSDITKDMIVMYKKEVLSRNVVTKSFIYSEYLRKE